MNPFIMSFVQMVGNPANIQFELVELQNHDALKIISPNKLSSTNSSENFSNFWKLVPKSELPAVTDLT